MLYYLLDLSFQLTGWSIVAIILAIYILLIPVIMFFIGWCIWYLDKLLIYPVIRRIKRVLKNRYLRIQLIMFLLIFGIVFFLIYIFMNRQELFYPIIGEWAVCIDDLKFKILECLYEYCLWSIHHAVEHTLHPEWEKTIDFLSLKYHFLKFIFYFFVLLCLIFRDEYRKEQELKKSIVPIGNDVSHKLDSNNSVDIDSIKHKDNTPDRDNSVDAINVEKKVENKDGKVR